MSNKVSLTEISNAGLLSTEEENSRAYLDMFALLALVFTFVLMIATMRMWFGGYTSIVAGLGSVAIILSFKLIARKVTELRASVVQRLGGELAAEKRVQMRTSP